ncbi:hypothetical protein AAV35_14110 [Salimicrobium jeotgali]|uniref:Uncharacterized protein n=1 Tax=Salimicrobium jeotgali TaxID=1230341 RepID=K2GLL1_9BACI|nr:DUF6241 domain-containing protein [Salimicrobium jeotgali]APC65564.1 hypothetical protein AAV35_14110 [Salimicrobium jeotgali]EKE31279.1 hypothetical protein MJ3_09243 [Salimicrobium jeotgali]MBM7697091.1 hypothetical protein [Salimicrobium jeotgali]
MVKKTMLWTLGILLLAGAGTWGYFYITGTENTETKEEEPSDSQEEKPKKKEEEKEVEELSEEKFEESSDEEELNPFGDEKKADTVPESTIRDYIHQMSHQKVQAEQKWGFYRITEERINWLSDKVKRNEYSEGDQYENILNAWSNGNFSNIDEHHNTIWKMQGGNVGKATGVLSEEEEQAYIDSAQ